MEFREVILERFQIAIAKAITGRQLAQNTKVSIQDPFNQDAMICTLSSYIWAEKFDPITETKTILTPLTWWDHFKERYKFGKVKYKEHQVSLTCTPRAIYPLAQFNDQSGPFVKIFTKEIPSNWSLED